MKIQSGHALNQFFAVIFYFTLRHKICPIETPRICLVGSSNAFGNVSETDFTEGLRTVNEGTSKIRVEIRSETDSNWW